MKATSVSTLRYAHCAEGFERDSIDGTRGLGCFEADDGFDLVEHLDLLVWMHGDRRRSIDRQGTERGERSSSLRIEKFGKTESEVGWCFSGMGGGGAERPTTSIKFQPVHCSQQHAQ